MKNNQSFDEHIKDQFQDYSPQVHPRIWENIVKEKDKKRPVGFWITFLNQKNILITAALLLAMATGAYFLVKDTNPAGITKNITAEKENSITKTEKVKSEPAPDNNTDLNSIAPLVSDGENNNTTTQSIVSANKKNIAPAILANNKISAIAPVSSVQNNFPVAGNYKIISAAGKSRNQKTRFKINYKDGTTTDFSDVEPENEYSLPLQLFTAQKYNAEKGETDLQNRKLTNVFLPDCPAIEKNAAGNKTYVEIYGGPDFAFRSLSDTANSSYLQKRKESVKFSSAFSAGLRYTKVYNNGVSVRTGINYSQINEKFIYSEGNIIQVVYIINAAGDTIGSYTTTGTRYKTTHNTFKTIDVPLVVGYEFGNGRFHTNVNAGIIVNVYSWQRGEVLNNSLQPVNITTGKSNSPYQFKTNIGLGFIAGASLYYKMNEKLHLLAEPYFRYNFTPASKEAITFKQKYNTAGLRVGLRLDLH
jgi:hypothetical protein